LIFIKTHWQILFILLLGVILRFFNLGLIPGPIFDEVFYPVFALNYLSGETFFSVHPPLGSYILTFGIYVYDLLPWTESIDFSLAQVEDMNPLSYRWIGAVSGIGLIYVGYRLALEVYDKKTFALLVALFFTLDGSLLSDSRLGLINIYLTLFGFMSILFFIRGIKSQSMGKLLLSSVMLGAVISIKWNGLGFWLSLMLLTFLIFVFNRTIFDSERKYEELGFRQILLVFFLPFIFYFILWLPDILHNEMTFSDKHSQMISYHFDNTDQKDHPYSSSWYTWPFMIRPIGYFFDSEIIINAKGVSTELFKAIHLFPNPALNFLSFISIILLTFKWIDIFTQSISNRKAQEDMYAVSLILIGFYANFLPWALAYRSTFIYHYQPAACFAFMALAFLLCRLINKGTIANMSLFYASLVVILVSGLYWLPLQLGLEISSKSFYSRMWFETWI
tara:strand:+ start:139 stop:1482 length:1344 start_codon:yes stop_codon:yes gene_type:complete